MLTINPNILDEGNQMEVLELADDNLDYIVRCNNCGKPTRYGDTRMIHGFVGCDNKITVDGKEVECYFEDLLPRVQKFKEDPMLHDYYVKGKVYRWRDLDGGKCEEDNSV